MKKGKYVKVGIDNLANFLFLFLQTKPIAVCLPGPRAGLFCHSCFNLCSVFRKAINLYLSLLNYQFPL
jgi:hypothetical protein